MHFIALLTLALHNTQQGAVLNFHNQIDAKALYGIFLLLQASFR